MIILTSKVLSFIYAELGSKYTKLGVDYFFLFMKEDQKWAI